MNRPRVLPATIGICSAIIALALLWARPADAHRANVFAWEEGGTIKVETSFSGGGPAINAPVQVRDDATDTLLLTVTTDGQGVASFPIPDAARTARSDLRLVLQAGQGHRGEWIIRADEYLGAPAGAETAPPAPKPAATATSAAKAAPAIDEATLERIVSAAVDKQIAPMRRTLAAMAEPGPSLRDVLSGLGYILGLFGIAAWARSRRERP